MRRVERQLFRLNDTIEQLRRQIELVEGELNMHRHLADDAARDAAVYEGIERAEARAADRDVGVLERALARVRAALARAEAKRAELLRRMDGGR